MPNTYDASLDNAREAGGHSKGTSPPSTIASRLVGNRGTMYYGYYVSGGTMRINSKGQVTIPAELRDKHDFRAGDEVNVIEKAGELNIVHVKSDLTRGESLVQRMRGKATTTMTTDQLLQLLRGE